MPKVSVIIPTYNRRGLVQKAIQSVLEQSYTDFELIVIDDGSNDGTSEMIKTVYGDKVRYIWQENQGESIARNHGIRVASGEYIGLLDSDDLWLPEKLARQVPMLEADPGLGAVFCWAYRMDKMGEVSTANPLGYGLKPGDLSLEVMLTRCATPGPSAGLFRKDVLEAIGGFDPQISYGEDWDIGLQILTKARMDFLPEALACYRIHSGQQSVDLDQNRIKRRYDDTCRIMKKIAVLCPAPEHQRLIHVGLARNALKTGAAYLMVGAEAEAVQMFQVAAQENPPIMEDLKIWIHLIISHGWTVFQEKKQLKELERFAGTILRLRELSALPGIKIFPTRLVWDRFWSTAVIWLFQDGQSRAAWTAWRAWVRNRPQVLFTSRGLKTTVQLLMGKKLVQMILSRKKPAQAVQPDQQMPD